MRECSALLCGQDLHRQDVRTPESPQLWDACPFTHFGLVFESFLLFELTSQAECKLFQSVRQVGLFLWVIFGVMQCVADRPALGDDQFPGAVLHG